ncbi:MAG: dihydrodipicolinate synthase family protein, partial [Burkholderiaceae bacterium]
MTRRPFEAKGVMPACLLPFNDDLSIDEAAYRRHLDDLLAVDGVTAVTVNGHASEVSSCTFDEQERILALSVEHVDGRQPLICGVYSESSLEAARLAKMAERNGAAALLVFPPFLFGRGARQRPDMILRHYGEVASATGLPLIIFQYALSGLGYTLDTLCRLVEDIPAICAMKDFCGEPAFHEKTLRTLRNDAARPISVLTTHSAWLLSSLVLGCDGILSGSGSTIADLHVEIF